LREFRNRFQIVTAIVKPDDLNLRICEMLCGRIDLGQLTNAGTATDPPEIDHNNLSRQIGHSNRSVGVDPIDDLQGGCLVAGFDDRLAWRCDLVTKCDHSGNRNSHNTGRRSLSTIWSIGWREAIVDDVSASSRS